MLLMTLCLTIPSTLLAQEASSLLDMSFVKKYLPAEYHSVAESQIESIKSVVGSGGSPTPSPAVPGVLGGLTGQVSTQTPLSGISIPPGPLQYTPPVAPPAPPVHSHTHTHGGGSFNPYMPSQAPAPSHTHYAAPAPAASVPLPVANTSAPQTVTASAGPSNPFLGGTVVQEVQAAPEFFLEADLNANPVFHPPQESSVPQYPPIEGQHWYQYVLVDKSLNPLN